jgi:hypothetical protein
MKTIVKIPYQQKTRAHRVLFEAGSPFKSRTVENKKREFKRNPKHRSRGIE